ncbi:hypothetical protein ACRALDRAFT_211382 [Sodiomyces alcalophilus JCM 7366]|uniref:uncharacterized protein n=1 Tax=Sodiomyces alcalophilus JCM 7366 TaxID=591952 RepID=UPI0039B647B7
MVLEDSSGWVMGGWFALGEPGDLLFRGATVLKYLHMSRPIKCQNFALSRQTRYGEMLSERPKTLRESNSAESILLGSLLRRPLQQQSILITIQAWHVRQEVTYSEHAWCQNDIYHNNYRVALFRLPTADRRPPSRPHSPRTHTVTGCRSPKYMGHFYFTPGHLPSPYFTLTIHASSNTRSLERTWKIGDIPTIQSAMVELHVPESLTHTTATRIWKHHNSSAL